jgi:hypothetical protein
VAICADVAQQTKKSEAEVKKYYKLFWSRYKELVCMSKTQRGWSWLTVFLPELRSGRCVAAMAAWLVFYSEPQRHGMRAALL